MAFRVAIAGSHTLDPAHMALHLLKSLSELPMEATILLRHPINGYPGPVEILTSQLCLTLKIEVEWRRPQPGLGREGTLFRDFDMVDDAGLVIAYFAADRVMQGGTGNVVERALHTGTPVRAYAPEGETGPALVGSDEDQEALAQK